MLSVQILCVGKLKEAFYEAAVEEYQKRLSRYCRLKVEELPEQRLSQKPSQAEIDKALQKEGEEILARLPKGGKLIALCVEGKLLSSPDFARELDRIQVGGTSQLTFVIGGSFGLHPSVKQAAALRLSLSNMTLPHHLARVVLLEQIYRGFTILEGTAYHK